MVVDSSALLAILQDEPESPHFTDLILSAPAPLISAATRFEASMVMLSRRGEAGLADLVAFCGSAAIATVPFDAAHAELALEGFRRFGRRFGKGGRHRAGLNFGDCVSYALARATNEPLLFKGEDFGLTDVRRAA